MSLLVIFHVLKFYLMKDIGTKSKEPLKFVNSNSDGSTMLYLNSDISMDVEYF